MNPEFRTVALIAAVLGLVVSLVLALRNRDDAPPPPPAGAALVAAAQPRAVGATLGAAWTPS